MRNRTWMTLVASLAIVAVGISYHSAKSQTGGAKSADHGGSKVTMAIATVEGLGDHKVKGTVTFTQKGDGVEIEGEFTGLQPGQHGFHIHEFGDCSMADGKCAGSHFNPNGGKHSSPEDPGRHAGDLGNLKADSAGKASFKMTDSMLSLSGENSVIGRSVIVHAKADDMKTQPSGDSGDKIGCGVIGIADPKMHAGH